MNVEKIMQKPEMKALIKIANLSKAIPTAKKMVKVSSLLTKEDTKRIEEYSLGTIAVKVGPEAFFLSKQHSVPADAIVQRDTENQILGIPAVAGG
jgi:hypothetical protein